MVENQKVTRTGSLILNHMLMQRGYPPINVKFADRQRYYSCFDSYYSDTRTAESK